MLSWVGPSLWAALGFGAVEADHWRGRICSEPRTSSNVPLRIVSPKRKNQTRISRIDRHIMSTPIHKPW
jgi:hypothetical protein